MTKSTAIFWVLIFFSATLLAQIQTGSEHPGYWEYQGEPVLLIGGWNHGHNPFLDHSTLEGGGYEDTSSEAQIVAALDELSAAGGNLVRCVLDPGVGAGRQGFDFCAKPDNLYDLNNMTGPYWDRLQFFLQETQNRDIIVGLEIWDRFDWYNGGHEGWPYSPFNPKNNINYTTESSGLLPSYEGKGDHSENPFGLTTPRQTAYDTASAEGRAQFDLIRSYQEKFMDKLLSVTLSFDHVLYSANNEVRHQEPAWGEYWINYIEAAAAAQGKSVPCTDMFWNIIDLPGPTYFDHLLSHTQLYDYFDISQTSAQRNKKTDTDREIGQKHWEMVSYAAEQANEVGRLLHMNKIYGSEDRIGSWMGSADNAVEEFWRSLIAGVAGVRFHRPESGIGLSEKSKNCMRAVRKVENGVKFWDVSPRQDLLTDMEMDEAYLAAQPGQEYVLFFTDGGSVGLNLNRYPDASFELKWIDITTGEYGATEHIQGGSIRQINAPGPAHWVAVMVRQ